MSKLSQLTLNVELMDQSEDRVFEVESAHILPPVRQTQGGDSEAHPGPVSSHRDPGVSHHLERVRTDHLTRYQC